MRRITVRLPEQQHQILAGMAQELSTDISGAFRALIASYDRTRLMLDALEANKQDIIGAVIAAREASTENLKRAVSHLSQNNMKEPK